MIFPPHQPGCPKLSRSVSDCFFYVPHILVSPVRPAHLFGSLPTAALWGQLISEGMLHPPARARTPPKCLWPPGKQAYQVPSSPNNNVIRTFQASGCRMHFLSPASAPVTQPQGTVMTTRARSWVTDPQLVIDLSLYLHSVPLQSVLCKALPCRLGERRPTFIA